MEIEPAVVLSDAAVNLLYQFRKDVASDDILHAMMLLIKFNKQHGENAVAHFNRIYASEEGQALNAARRKVDMLYDSVRIFTEEWNVIPEACVSGIMEPGSVDSFLKWVNPLSVGKPSPKANIAKQELFWKKFGTGGTPAIINAI